MRIYKGRIRLPLNPVNGRPPAGQADIYFNADGTLEIEKSDGSTEAVGGGGGDITQEDLNDLADQIEQTTDNLDERLDDLEAGSDPTPHATDNDKLLSSPTIGEVVSIYGEASRIERFVGNLADPTRFFASGAPVFDFDEEGDNEYLNLDLNGYCYPYMGDLAQILQWNAAGDALTYFAGESGAWQWVLNSEPDPVLYTSTDVCEHVSQVTNWTPNPTYPELPAAPTLTAWDNSGFTFPIAIFTGYNVPPYAIPVSVFNGRNQYMDIENWSCSYDPDGSEGAGWYFGADVYNYYSPSDAAYPWQVDDWAFFGDSEDDPEVPVVITRAPAANNDNWVVLRNTVALYINWAEGAGATTINGVVFGGESTETDVFVGWVDPLEIPLAAPDTSPFVCTGIELGAVVAGGFSVSVSSDQSISLPAVTPNRGIVTLTFE